MNLTFWLSIQSLIEIKLYPHDRKDTLQKLEFSKDDIERKNSVTSTYKPFPSSSENFYAHILKENKITESVLHNFRH